MRVIVIGGTRFIGRALLGELLAHGDEVLLVHRGRHEPADLPDVPHLHANRRELAGRRAELAAFRADVLVDLCAMTGPDTEALLAAIPGDPRLVVASSMDTYRAFGSVHAGTETDAVPVDESSPVRDAPLPPLPRRAADAWDFDQSRYEKLDVERAYLERGGTVLRLPVVYGEHDTQRREEPILARVRAGRERIPVGPGSWLFTKGYVGDIAAGIRQAAASDAVAGEVFNLCERRTASMGLWYRWVLDAAGSSAELVRVPEPLLPEDLRLTGAISQHLLVDAAKAREVLGYTETDPREALRRSVTWHLANPPEGATADFAADDAALAAADGEATGERGT